MFAHESTKTHTQPLVSRLAVFAYTHFIYFHVMFYLLAGRSTSLRPTLFPPMSVLARVLVPPALASMSTRDTDYRTAENVLETARRTLPALAFTLQLRVAMAVLCGFI